jgi:predicted dienelactone hydrolase
MISFKSCLMMFGVVLLFVVRSACATNAGLLMTELAMTSPNKEIVNVAFFYPTDAAAVPVQIGPFVANVALRAAPAKSFKGLILLSHGLGGSELGHVTIAQALARAGYLVAAMRHPRDNYRDRSLLNENGLDYFVERPKQASSVVDAILNDPSWRERVSRDSRGYKIAALGHSAGGYTVLALAGARPDLAQLTGHCQKHRAQDPIFCGVRRRQPLDVIPASEPTLPRLRDPRFRAVAAMAPTGAVINTASLEEIVVPVALFIAGSDRFLVPRFHAELVAQHVKSAKVTRVAEAPHFAFMDKPTQPILTEDGDIAADPAGFDRSRFLEQTATELVVFFDRVLAESPASLKPKR